MMRLQNLAQVIRSVSCLFYKKDKINRLASVMLYAKSKSAIIYDHLDIEKVILSCYPLSQQDANWRQSIACPQSYIAKLKKIIMITGTSLLMTKRGQVLSDMIEYEFRTFGHRPKLWDMELADGAVISKMPVYEMSEETIATGIHLTGEYETNYFHWLVEILPKLYLYEQLDRKNDLPIIVSEGNHQNMYTLLNLVCSKKRTIIKCKPRVGYRVKRLIHLPSVSTILSLYDRAPCHDTVYIPVGLLKRMVLDILSKVNVELNISYTRIYVRRNSTYRNLLNQDVIEKILIENGFTSIDPGCLSVEEQINIFRQASIIVGPSGAAMTNMLWCQPHTKIIVLHSDHPYKKYPYWDALARVAEAEIRYLAGPRANTVTDYFEVHDDYTINVDELLTIIQINI